MKLSERLTQHEYIFIDTAPIIYYIEANTKFGALVKIVVDSFQKGDLLACTSVLTLTEVLIKPVQKGNQKLVSAFSDFLRYGKNFNLLDINPRTAEQAAILRGRYSFLKTMDAIQISSAVEAGADAFITNDKNLKNIDDIEIILLLDYL